MTNWLAERNSLIAAGASPRITSVSASRVIRINVVGTIIGSKARLPVWEARNHRTATKAVNATSRITSVTYGSGEINSANAASWITRYGLPNGRPCAAGSNDSRRKKRGTNGRTVVTARRVRFAFDRNSPDGNARIR